MLEWESFYLSLPSEVLKLVKQKAQELHWTDQAVICDIVEKHFNWKEKPEDKMARYIVYCHFDCENPTCTVYARYKENEKSSFIGNIFNVKSKQELLDFAAKNYFISESDIEFVD